MKYKIVVLPGDGIGPEVVNSAVRVMNLAAEKSGIQIETDYRLMGGCSYEEYGEPLTDETIEACYQADAVLLGAVGGPKWDNLRHDLKPEAGLLKIRKALGLYTNIRPAMVFDPLLDASSIKPEVLSGTDFVVFRELTGGIYFGQPRGYDDERGFNTMEYTKPEVIRIARMAFETARIRKGVVTSVDKANVLECSQFWRKTVHELHAAEYQDVRLNDMYVDNAAMQIVRDPKQFDVILTSNLFGDILSDIAGMITGSLGMLPSASLGDKYALYEPVHGSAPDIAGQNKANPLAAIMSVSMMFTHSFKLPAVGEMIRKAVDETLAQGYRTGDIYSEGTILASTEEMTEEVTDNLLKQITSGQVEIG
ncbi:MAG: 3-isopropylmalate dehydrogenase [Bacteroidota bacterium]